MVVFCTVDSHKTSPINRKNIMDLKMPIGMTVGELTRKTATYVNTILLTIVMQKITLPVTTIVSCVMQIS